MLHRKASSALHITVNYSPPLDVDKAIPRPKYNRTEIELSQEDGRNIVIIVDSDNYEIVAERPGPYKRIQSAGTWETGKIFDDLVEVLHTLLGPLG